MYQTLSKNFNVFIYKGDIHFIDKKIEAKRG